jgi:hypothetical protein
VTTSADVPGRLPCAIDGHAYLCEPDYERTTVDVIRQQSDASTEPGEQSLSPYGLWRRSQESWHHGVCQPFLDGRVDGSATDTERYRTSRGIDPWTRGQIGLLPATIRRRASANTNLAVMSIGQYVYIVDGTELLFGPGWSNMLADNDSGFETSVAGWAAGANTTIARSTAQFEAGVASMSLTATGAGDVSANTPTGTSGIPVIANRVYSINASFRAATTARTFSPYIDWYDSGGSFISSTAAITGTDSTSTWSSSGRSDPSPVTAAYASIRVVLTALGAAEVHYVDSVNFTPGTLIGGNITWFSADIQAGEAAQTIRSATTNGYHVWAALGTSGIHRANRATTSSTANVPGPGAGWFTLVGWANGFLLAAGSDTSTSRQNVLFLINDPLGTPTATVIKTHINTDFVWAGIGPGRNCVYAWGNSGDRGEVYKILFDPNTGSLSTAASFATYLPDGENIHALQFYAGGIIMGTGKGLRIGQADGAGNIDYGPLISTRNPVLALEPQDRYCWFSYTNPDSTSTGLGRIDLGFLVDTLTPAWAPDLFAQPWTGTSVQGSVTSIASFLPAATPLSTPSHRWFAVSGVGFFAEDASLAGDALRVASGTLETGNIRYGTTEKKTICNFDVRHHALPGGSSVSVAMNRDTTSWGTIGTSSTANSNGPAASLDAGSGSAESVEFRLTLARVSGGRSITASWVFGSTTLTVTSGTVTAADVGWVLDTVATSIPPSTRIVSIVDSTHAVLSTAATATGSGAVIIGSPLHGPEVVRWTAKVLPTPSTIDETFTLTLKMAAQIETNEGESIPLDVPTEVAFIKTLEQTRRIIQFQVGSDTFTGYVLKSQFKGNHWVSPAREYAEGPMTVVLQTVRA